GGSERERATPARRDQPLEPRQGPELGAAPARTRLRGRLRSHARDSVPPRRALRSLASRQATGRLPLRPARGHTGLSAGAWLRRARGAPSSSRVAPGGGVGSGRLPGRPFALGTGAWVGWGGR